MMMASTEEGQRNEMMASSLHHRFKIFHHILTILINKKPEQPLPGGCEARFRVLQLGHQNDGEG